jgi:hypothetical protein
LFFLEAWLLCGDSVRQFSNMLSSFLNLNALPVPLLRQVFLTPLKCDIIVCLFMFPLKVLKSRFLDCDILMCI